MFDYQRLIAVSGAFGMALFVTLGRSSAQDFATSDLSASLRYQVSVCGMPLAADIRKAMEESVDRALELSRLDRGEAS